MCIPSLFIKLQRSFFLTCLSLLLCLSFSIQSNAQWILVKGYPGPARHHPVTFGLNGFGYLLAGTTENGDVADMYKYDPTANDWTVMDDFPGGPRGFAYGVATGNKAYVGFGSNRANQTTVRFFDLWEFDGTTEEWKRLADCECTGRRHPALVATSTHIYVGLGGDEDGDQNDWWGYEIASDSWKQLADFPSDRRHHPFYFQVDDIPYVGFGHGGPNIYNDLYAYDAATDTWEEKSILPSQARVAGTQFSYGNKGYILSGDGNQHDNLPTGEFWEYSPATDSWTELPPHPGQGRWAPGTFVIDNRVYLTSGETSTLLNDLWLYILPEEVSTSEPVESTNLEFYPNPANDFIYFKHSNNKEVEIFDARGRSIQRFKTVGLKMDISTLNPGVYYLKVTDQKGQSHLNKLIIAE